jgi:hypothetical protein
LMQLLIFYKIFIKNGLIFKPCKNNLNLSFLKFKYWCSNCTIQFKMCSLSCKICIFLAGPCTKEHLLKLWKIFQVLWRASFQKFKLFCKFADNFKWHFLLDFAKSALSIKNYDLEKFSLLKVSRINEIDVL